jgi:hypothetical protein
MSIFFLHPAYLLGLFAALLPIAIHLLNRRRIQRIRFPAVRFILLSQRRISRSYRLRHWLLLALRTLAIVLLALLLANPVFQSGAGLLATGGPVSVALILDNSLSMEWSGGLGGFERAKEVVRRRLAMLGEGDRAALIPTNGQHEPALVSDRGALLRALEGVRTTAASADFVAALRKAYALLAERAAEKEIWIVSDGTLTGWERFSVGALEQYDPSIPLKIVRVGAPPMAPNATVKEVRLEGNRLAAGLRIALEAVIANFSDEEVSDLLVQLRLNGQSRDQRLVRLAPRSETKVAFQLELPPAGHHAGEVVLRREGLVGNPTHYFTLRVTEPLRVLVVDGDPKTSLVQSESFFLARALNPTGEPRSSPFLPTVILPEALASTALQGYQAVILCNVSSIPAEVARKLSDHVRRGGGLLFFLGDRVRAEEYNGALLDGAAALLPGRIGEKRTLSGERAERIRRVGTEHPALSIFAEPIAAASLEATAVNAYFRVEARGSQALLWLGNGDPLLVEKRLGAGRVFLFAASADRDWSDLPLKTAYVPLVQSLVGYASGGHAGDFDPGIPAGAEKRLSLGPDAVGRTIRVASPSGNQLESEARVEREAAVLSIARNDEAGIYRILYPGRLALEKELPQIYAVNAPYLESRLTPFDEGDLRTRFSPIEPEILSYEALAEGGKRIDLALPLALFLLATLIGEGYLALRFSS